MTSAKRSLDWVFVPSSLRTCRWITAAPASRQRAASSATSCGRERQVRRLRARELGADDGRRQDHVGRLDAA